MDPHRVFLALLVVACCGVAQGALFFAPIDLQPYGNAHYKWPYEGAAIPEGNVTLGGVPFYLPDSDTSGWDSRGTGTTSVDIPIGLAGVREVHTLINSRWGDVGPYTKLEFFGSDGAFYEKSLYGNSDMRDWLRLSWTNTINNTTTVNVWSGPCPNWGGRQCDIDKQQIVLPPAFHTQTLEKVRMSDWGSTNVHRSFLTGLSVAVSGGPCDPGDADGDGDVDDDDLSLLLAHWGADTDCTYGEFNGLPPVNDDDLSLLLANWTGSLGRAPIPEPVTMALMLLGASVLTHGHRRP